MKRIVFVALSAFVLFVPSFAAAQGTSLVYRPELRAYVPVPQQAKPVAPAAAPAADETAARREPMACGHTVKGNTDAQATPTAKGCAHCEQMAKQTADAPPHVH